MNSASSLRAAACISVFRILPGGSDIGVNIPGFAYFGREPYSTVDRIERRTEFTDHVTLLHGNHTFKMGGDVNVVQLRSGKAQIFQLDFGGDVNFGGLSASTFGRRTSPGRAVPPWAAARIALPATTGLQSYGLGIPTTYIQGIGDSNRPFDNLPFRLFLSGQLARKQKIHRELRRALRRGNYPAFSRGHRHQPGRRKRLGRRRRHSPGQ